MHAVVIDIYTSEAYIALEDGTNACIGLSHVPYNIKPGSKINVSINTINMSNHKMPNILF
ncbi:hypothetical protein SAMN05428976_105115 [Clostridium sp. USBA 49]|jgi:pyridoxal biosynthesis lyase PdxS|uniref:hypothetical protein n=1 Tax=Clostridium TaxID=1485 RepID=UPI00099AE549|nr:MULTISPECIES: hypothetical protein [Clostridium]SKA82807.1 hypothetical protein SAMN05428976_105115 [Clostridium sp. USBA 49]